MTSEFSTIRLVRISGLAIVLGAIMAGVAQLLLWLIGHITSLAFFGQIGSAAASPVGNHLGAAVILVPVAGGVIVGLMARYGSPAIRGHGIPEAMEQVLENASRIPARITWLKPLSAAISIGTGGPFGAEGPIIATGGAGGSLLGQILPTSAAERKTLLAAGAAAGMAATFGSPLSALLLTVELLLFEFKARSLIPVALAVSVATAMRSAWVGNVLMFPMPSVTSPSMAAFAGLLLLALGCGVLAWGLSRAVYWIEDGFARLPIHWMWWPAIGGILVGVVGYVEPRTFGVGYENIIANLAGALPAVAIISLCSLKFLSWSVSLGSGTSGGTLAPLMTIGSGFGYVAGLMMHSVIPSLDVHLAALVGMACVFGGASQAFLASAVFAYETTGQGAALFPLLACGAVSLVVVRALGRTSIMTEKIERRGVRVPSQFSADVFEHTSVERVMETDVLPISASMPLAEFARRVASDHPSLRQRHSHPIVDSQDRLVGVITRGDLIRFSERETSAATLADCATKQLIVVYPSDSLHDAIHKLLVNDIGRLPVVDPREETRMVGWLSRRAILSARWKIIDEESPNVGMRMPWHRTSISTKTEKASSFHL